MSDIPSEGVFIFISFFLLITNTNIHVYTFKNNYSTDQHLYVNIWWMINYIK